MKTTAEETLDLKQPFITQVELFDGELGWVKVENAYKSREKIVFEFENGISKSYNQSDTIDIAMVPVLTAKKNHKTPRLLVTDAYTLGSGSFVSEECKEKSSYYMTFRRQLYKINPDVYTKGDDRIIFSGVQKIIDEFLRYPVTHKEIDETIAYLAIAKATTNGLTRFKFDEQMWRRVVDSYNGYPPIEIMGLPEGSVVYPNEPNLAINSLIRQCGELAAWFESKLLQSWAASERITQSIHFRNKLATLFVQYTGIGIDLANEYASRMIHDFGDRSGICSMESEVMGMAGLYIFPGTDTFAGGYQAWKNGAKVPGVSVSALAHRIVQGFENEQDAYNTLYESLEKGEIGSNVSDCYDFWYATKNYLLPLALKSQKEGNGKIVVDRPDSGNALEQILYICNLAKDNGLFTSKMYNGVEYYCGTYLKFIEGDGMDFGTIYSICQTMLDNKFLPWEWGLFGVGGGQRNEIKRDNLSAKYALCARGTHNKPVVKFSETIGKTTLPGPFKLSRSKKSLANKQTIYFDSEDIDSAFVTYYTGYSGKPFGEGMQDDFEVIKQRINTQFASMPLTLWDDNNHGYPASDLIRQTRKDLLKKYAPESLKLSSNY